jgi:hypothetical protein
VTKRRPQPACTFPTKVPDGLVERFTAMIDASGALELIERRLGQRPGPEGLAPRTILVGLLLALYYCKTANLDDAAEILHLSLSPRMQAMLGVRAVNGADSCDVRAAYMRCTRSFNAITTGFDPHRHDRRRRLSRAHAREVMHAWDNPANAQVIEALCELANTLIQATVKIAINRKMLRHWRGDIGADATPVRAWGRPPSRRRGPLDIGAGWYRRGGLEELVWAYSATLVITGHGDPAAEGRYPQLCLSMHIHRPGSETGSSAIKALRALENLQLLKRFLAADRAYPRCKPKEFQIPARAMGYKLLFDYDVLAHGRQGGTLGAVWRGGQLYCPALPENLLEAGKLLRKRASAEEVARGKELVLGAEKYRLQVKETPRADGSYRMQCPAAGPSPTVTCPRAEARGTKQRETPRTVDLDDPRARLRHPAALHRVIPDNTPQERWPKCCTQASITILPTDNAEFAQALAHGTPQWVTAYKSIRAQNEGGNGWLKGIDTTIDTPRFRLARGRVAQIILVALGIAIANLRRLENFLRDQHEDPATLLDYLLPEGQAPSVTRDGETPAPDTPANPPPAS